MDALDEQFFRDLVLDQKPFLDVRASVEFAEGAIPGSINIPILNDEERALIGLTYKQRGNAEATRLGFELVSGENRERKIAAWKSLAESRADLVIYCFRGGQRSRIAQNWLEAAGLSRPRISGGYKSFRQFLMAETAKFSQRHPFLLISGPTGSGKSHFLRRCREIAAIADLEELAHHKGSAFGKEDRPQPSQSDFENRLAFELIRADEQIQKEGRIFLVEDESRMIGKSVQPELFFETLRQSPVIWLELSLEDRVENIFKDYVTDTAIAGSNEVEALKIFARYEIALSNIQRRLGGLRFAEVAADLAHCKHEYLAGKDLSSHRIWIRKLLEYYYDPLYESSLEKRKPPVTFRGSPEEAFYFLNSARN